MCCTGGVSVFKINNNYFFGTCFPKHLLKNKKKQKKTTTGKFLMSNCFGKEKIKGVNQPE